MSGLLPEGFEELEPFVADWALPNERSRNAKRTSSSVEELRRFADAVGPRVPEIGRYLDQFPMQELAEQQRSLLYLAMLYTDVGFALQFYSQPVLAECFDLSRMKINDVPLIEHGAPLQ